MKLLITIIFLFLATSCIPLPAQNVISLTYAGNDMQIGARYDRQFSQKWGVYAGAGYGNYVAPSIGRVEHTRASVGVVRYLINYAEPDWLTFFSLGVGAHNYTQIRKGFVEVPRNALYPVSLELGVGFIITKRLCVGWTFDPIKADGLFNIGYRFGH